MSDRYEELWRRYQEDVHFEHPRSIGLFPIPEYPELEPERGMWSSALDAILTTLRYLAPATLLTLFWGQQSFLFTILKHIDNLFRCIVFSSEEQKQAVLKWLSEAGPVKVEQLDTVWRHGWILCGVLDASLPGACAGHPSTRLSIKHAQAIADHYLGVEPVFSRQELESNDSLSKHQEWKLATYLDRVRIALSKITPPVSKPTSQRTSPETTQFTLDYVAKGSGLTAAQVNHKMSFKIYPTSQQALDPGEVTILIRGPKDTYGMMVLPPILGKAQKIRQQMLGLKSKQTFTEKALPITQGATYLRAYGKNDMNKTYFIPKTVYDIEIETEDREDHIKVAYTVTLEGKYEISITSRGQNIVGSPFIIRTSYNILSILEKENMALENGEEIDIVDVKNDRKVVLRIVDFVTEKMLLRENGVLEKITEDEAKLLMSTDVETEQSFSVTEIIDHMSSKHYKENSHKFNKAVTTVLKMNRVCKAFQNISKVKEQANQGNITNPRNHKHIPDIVNSTLSENNSNPFTLTEKRDKYIIPENLSVSIITEKSKSVEVDDIPKIDKFGLSDLISSDSLSQITEDDNILLDRMTPLSANNPFLADVCEDFTVEKKMGTFVKSEYERNNSLNEETRDNSIKIIVDTNDTPSPITNPFYDPDIRELERPKTPVYKIITGEISHRIDSPYLDSKNQLLSEEFLGNEFVNPFFMHQLQSNQNYEQPPVTDFIIGAPVSLPPTLRAASPELGMVSLSTERQDKINHSDEATDDSPLVFSTPVHSRTIQKSGQTVTSSVFHSLDSTIDNSNTSTTSDNQFEPYTEHRREFSPKKEIWDSAYVSIDDSNSSPDSNNNDHEISENVKKLKLSNSKENSEDLSNMGPAERELWQTCDELNETSTIQDVKPFKWEIKRPTFTPIIEESDRSISSGIRDTSLKHNETDSITMAFTELNDMYLEYFPNSVKGSVTNVEENKFRNTGVEHTIETDDTGVESASETISDVIRHETKLEGTISEVQVNVTESVSASQTLHDQDNINFRLLSQEKDKTQFGDKENNIVLEKKKYWDEKIRQIEAIKTEEIARHPKRRRTYAKQLKHDSLSKRKGKQIVKKILNSNDAHQAELMKQVNVGKPEINECNKQNIEEVKNNEKLVVKWKKYWDEKLENEDFDTENRAISPKNAMNSTCHKTQHNHSHKKGDKSPIPVKHELPEEVFKAFETSPKRFFGTSRKHILNKIDTFIGKPSSTTTTTTELSGVSPDSGLVSSRINLFHNMSNIEPSTSTKIKSQSLHNINQRKDSEKSNISTEGSLVEVIKNEHETINIEQTKLATDALENNLETVSVKNKRARIAQISFNKSFDETDYHKAHVHSYTNKSKSSHIDKYKKSNSLRRTSLSKSEMDIFSKIPNDTAEFEKHKSCDELPKINVKSFISLYEQVTKSCEGQKPGKRTNQPNSEIPRNLWQTVNITSDAEKKGKIKGPIKPESLSAAALEIASPIYSRNIKISESTSLESLDSTKTDNMSLGLDVQSKKKESIHISLSDIELEIIESRSDKSDESSPERTGQPPHIDYKHRFEKAKQFFQSLEELREVRRPPKLNECEMLLLNKSSESLEKEKTQKRLKKKSHSMPSSEIAKYWNQMQESQKEEPKESTKLVKISEKFHVDDLFSDVMEGRLSRQGSLKGIPHKKAVLEAFRSMENISNSKMSHYEETRSQVNDFTKENTIRDAQNYLREYPYLPTTDPSKFHSRLDAKASGLITLKELLEKKVRRNSVPDLRMNTKFSADL